MQTTDPMVLDVARRLADSLEAAGIPYAIGGALAYGYWAPARGTHDVDANVFLEPTDIDAALDAIASAGIDIDRPEAKRRAAEGANVIGRVGTMPVDIFFNSIELHHSAAKRTRTRDFLNRPAQILSAEDLIVLKLLFHRGKDRLDVERIVGFQRGAIEKDYVRHWLVACVGEDDYRVSEWDQLLRDLDL